MMAAARRAPRRPGCDMHRRDTDRGPQSSSKSAAIDASLASDAGPGARRRPRSPRIPARGCDAQRLHQRRPCTLSLGIDPTQRTLPTQPRPGPRAQSAPALPGTVILLLLGGLECFDGEGCGGFCKGHPNPRVAKELPPGRAASRYRRMDQRAPSPVCSGTGCRLGLTAEALEQPVDALVHGQQRWDHQQHQHRRKGETEGDGGGHGD